MNDTGPRSEKLRRVVGRIVRLPTLPDNIAQIQKRMRAPDITTTEVGDVIGRDPPLAAQILKLVNSGFYGFTKPIASISHAVVLLGFGTIKTLLVSSAVSSMMIRCFPGLFPHSLACARMAFVLAQRLGLEDPEEISSAALLHDIGKIALADRLPDDFRAVARQVEDRNELFFEAENRILGVTHADIGEWLLEKWRLPPGATQPIGRHHRFAPNLPFAESTAILHLADILVRAEGVGFAGDQRMPTPDPRAIEALGLRMADLRPIMDEGMEKNRDLLERQTADGFLEPV